MVRAGNARQKSSAHVATVTFAIVALVESLRGDSEYIDMSMYGRVGMVSRVCRLNAKQNYAPIATMSVHRITNARQAR